MYNKYLRMLALFFCVCFIATLCSDQILKSNYVNVTTGKSVTNGNNQDKFEIIALKSDKQGINKSTSFQLTAKEKTNERYIKENLEITPSQEYKIEEVSSTVFNIIPSTYLKENNIYQLKLNDESYAYSWAFQTKKKFEIEKTIPDNDSSYVPNNSGIELYFTLSDLDNIDGYFEISPKAEGKFIQKDNSVIFVPEKLEGKTNYTVTVKKGFGVKDNDQKLEQDYSFSFTTEGQIDSRIYFDSPLTNIYENNVKVIGAYANYNDKEIEFNINIYQLKNADSFAENLKSYADTCRMSTDNNADFTKISSIKEKPYKKTDNNYRGQIIFGLPEELTKGYYLAEFTADGETEKYYQFIQINDMLIYQALFANQILVSASDGATSKGIKNAFVSLNGEALGATDENGILLCNKDTSVYKDKTALCFRIKANGYQDFIFAESSNFSDYYYENLDDSSKYLRYIDTDRPVYLPTDKINVWGFARFRGNKAVDKVRVDLVENGTELVLDSKYVDLTNIGTYQTDFVLDHVTSDYYGIEVYDHDIKISSTHVSISRYEKPIYMLSGEFDKKVVYSWEELNYKINGEFFDGYPTSNFEVHVKSSDNYYVQTAEYVPTDLSVLLDEKGEAQVKINTVVQNGSWRPKEITVHCWNGTAEDEAVNLYDSFDVFPKRNMLEIEQYDRNEPQNIRILMHELDKTGYDPNEYYYFSYKPIKDLWGKPLDGTVKVKIVEGYYDKIKTGEEYDYINKVNQAKYKYKLIENTIYDQPVDVAGGTADITIPDFNKDRTYKVIASYDDGLGGIIEESSFDASTYDYEQNYNLRSDKDTVRLHENVNLQMAFNGTDVENTENDKLLILAMNNGLVDYKISYDTSTQLSFQDAYIPNVMLNAIYLKNGYTYCTETYENLYYDTSEKQIYFDVTTDKKEYRPGEEVTINVKAKDENNKPCIADVNISVVDEAYFAVFPKGVNTLQTIYRLSWNAGLIFNYMSNIDLRIEENAVEKGGGGEDYFNFRDEFKDTLAFKTLTTDKNGNASMKFKLADNLTSWRITYQGVSDKQYAGSGQKNISVSLPFYVNMIMGREYLKNDKICAALRVFGTSAGKADKVNYKVTVKDKATGKEKEYAKTGAAGEYTNVFLDKLDIGDYEIYASAECKGLRDGIKEEFQVVDSTVYFNNTGYYKLSDNTVLNEVYSNPIITLYNESSSDFYNSLDKISSGSGKRIDQSACGMIAAKYINEYFKTDLHFNEKELMEEIVKYESEKGGLCLLPYSDPDEELTAKFAYTLDNDYFNAKMKLHFKNILKDTKEFNTNVSAALWGLSKYKEPVLLQIYDLLENKDLQFRDKIYLSLALAELGDYKTAKKYYKEFVGNNLKEAGEYLYFDNASNDTDNYELTALVSILGVKLQDYENSDKLFKYIYNNPSPYVLSNLEQLIYIMNRDIMKMDEIKDLFGEVTVTADGTKQNYQLKLFDRKSFAITKEKIKDVKFSGIKGSIACKVEALGNKDDLDKNKTDDVSLGVTYTLKNSNIEQTEYHHSDTVKVTVIPSFSSNADSNRYEITYVVPSGFRYLEADKNSTAWAQENGQKLKFDIYYNKEAPDIKPIVFYIQAAQTGEYTVDYVVIKEYLDNKLNYLNQSTLTVN